MENLAVVFVYLVTIAVLVESKCRGTQCGYDCCKTGERCVIKKVDETYGYSKSMSGKSSSEAYGKDEPQYLYECVDAKMMCGTEQCRSGEMCYHIIKNCEYEPCPSEFKCLNPTGLCGLQSCPSDKLCFQMNSCETPPCPSNSMCFVCLLPQQCVGTTCASPKQCSVTNNCPTPPCSPTFQCVTNTNNCGTTNCPSGKRCVVQTEPSYGLKCSTYECVDNAKMCGDIECPYDKLCFINEDSCNYEGYSTAFSCLKNKTNKKQKHSKKPKY